MDADAAGIIDVDIDHDDSDEDDEPSTSSRDAFATSMQVFIVRSVSKATSGFRPSVTCEGYLAEVASTHAGYTLSPLGSDQQLSFKYEPPSPKFSRKRPGSISYRLQLLHGSQFLYSLRGLPQTLRCQRAAHALEWGPAHVAFTAAADMDTFLATLKYVDVEEVIGSDEQPSAAAAAAGEAGAPPGSPPTAKGAAGAGQLRPQLSLSLDGGVVWPAHAAKLWLDLGEAGDANAPAAAAAGDASGGTALAWLRRQAAPLLAYRPPPLPLPVLGASAAAAAALAAAAAAAYLLGGRPRRGASVGR